MPSASFDTFGTQHLTVLAITAVIAVVLVLIARHSPHPGVATCVARTIGGVLLLNEVAHWCFRLATVGWDRFLQLYLPLHVCPLTVLATAATLLWRHRKTYEIVYYWGLAGALNAVLTPDRQAGAFPEYLFFQYFTAHSGIVVGVAFATWGLGLRPTLAGLWRAFAGLNLLALAVGAVNLWLGSNYMYLRAPPEGTATPFFFLPWPWYLVALEVIGLALFLLVYAPFPLAGWWQARRSKGPRFPEPPRDGTGGAGQQPPVRVPS